MAYRLHVSADDGVTPLLGVTMDDTDENYPVTEGEDKGPIVNVQRKKPDPIIIVLSAATGPESPVLKLSRQAMFNLVVTESVEVNEGNEVVDVDVAITRYTRLKPYGVRRSAEKGRVFVYCMTFDRPVDEQP